jgi:hypothetical protein
MYKLNFELQPKNIFVFAFEKQRTGTAVWCESEHISVQKKAKLER